MDSKDARESLESGGGGSSGSGARCRCSNGRRRRKAAAVFVIHSLLTAACAALSLNIYLSQQDGSSKPHERGIHMQMTNVNSDKLEFTVIWSEAVALNDKTTVKLPCGGPYMVYLWACVTNYTNERVVNLTMKQGTKSFHLETLRGKECKEMQKVIMLSNENEVTVTVGKGEKDHSKIEQLFLSLHYMLGAQCFPSPKQKE